MIPCLETAEKDYLLAPGSHSNKQTFKETLSTIHLLLATSQEFQKSNIKNSISCQIFQEKVHFHLIVLFRSKEICFHPRRRAIFVLSFFN